MSHVNTIATLRRLAPLALLVALAACSGKDEPAPAAPAAAPAAAPVAAPAVSAKVQSMGTEELRDLASKALRENRMYAPAGDNAIEYYLALRDKTPDDASVKSALTDLLPYTLIAAEQSLGREDFAESQRLVALIEKVDATAPALPRLKQGISGGMQTALKRTQEETDKVKKDAENRTKQLADQQRLASSRRSKPKRPAPLPPSRTPRAATANARMPSARPAPAARPSSASRPPPPSRPPRPVRPPPRRQRHRACVRSAPRPRVTRPKHCVRVPPAKCWWKSPLAPTARSPTPACCAPRRRACSTARRSTRSSVGSSNRWAPQ